MRLRSAESGQTAVEYALLVSIIVLFFAAVVLVLPEHVYAFYYDTASLICLPIP